MADINSSSSNNSSKVIAITFIAGMVLVIAISSLSIVYYKNQQYTDCEILFDGIDDMLEYHDLVNPDNDPLNEEWNRVVECSAFVASAW